MRWIFKRLDFPDIKKELSAEQFMEMFSFKWDSNRAFVKITYSNIWLYSSMVEILKQLKNFF